MTGLPAPEAKRRIFHLYIGAALALFFIVMYLLPLGVRPMARPDEFRYAEIPREMIGTGDWVAPRFVGVRYFEKPALGYQLTALSFSVFGRNAFALRLPAALGAALSALLLYLLLLKKSDDPFLPGLAAALYLASGIVFGVGTFAVLDSQLACAVTLTVGFFYFAWDAERRSGTIVFLLLAGGAAGCAFLLKGFLAFVLPCAVAVPFLLWMKDWKKLFLYPWLPAAAALLVLLPWAFAIHQAEPDFWRYFIMEEHWNRFTGSTYDRDPEPVWFYLPFLIGGMLPAGLLCVTAWRGWTKELFRTPLTRFLLCWFLMPFLFFSVSSCKVGTYILPCFAPLAALIAYGTLGSFRKAPERFSKRLSVFAASAAWLLLAAALLTGIVLIFRKQFSFIPGAVFANGVFPFVLSGSAALLWGAALLLLVRGRGGAGRLLAMLLFGIAPFTAAVLTAVPYDLFKSKLPERGMAVCLERMPVSKNDIVYTDRNALSPAAWMLGRTDIIVVANMGELQYGFKQYPGEYAGRFVEQEWMLSAQPPPPDGAKRIYVTFRDLKRKPLSPYLKVLERTEAHGVSFLRF